MFASRFRNSLAVLAGLSLAVSEASAGRDIAFAADASDAGAVIVAVREGAAIEAQIEGLSTEDGEAIREGIAATGFAPKPLATASFVGARSVTIIGIKSDGMRSRDWQDFGAIAALAAGKLKAERVAVVVPAAYKPDGPAIAVGAVLGQYDFLKYKSNPKERGGSLVIVGTADAAADYERSARHVAEATVWARDLQSEPANVLYPEEFVRRARAAFDGVPNISIEALDVATMEKRGMGAILGVGQGSVRPPRLLVVYYRGGSKDDAPIAFVGKGITFDSGGISIKPNTDMWKMKADMTGAGVAVATVMALAKSKTPVNAIGVAALAENMPDGGAIRPGDVVKSMSGKTIEIMSTDAEGRLVLADAVWYVQKTYKPRMLIDIATLTGSVGRALGDEYAGVFTREDAIANRLIVAGERTGEDLWRLPLHHNHFEQIQSSIADLKNSSTGEPGASTAAAFIASFILRETPWAHLDIAGVDWRDNSDFPTMPKGASGFGVRLLYDYAANETGKTGGLN